MSFNLVDSVKGLFSNDLVSSIASSAGESEGGVQKALSGAIPSVLTGLLSKATSGTEGVSGILNMAKDAAGSGILNNLSGLLGGGSASGGLMNMVSGLFGDKLGGITSLISNFAGVKQSSASSILSMVAPAALGLVGKHATQNNLGASGLLSFFNSQKDNILSSVPGGLNLAGALGLGSLSGLGDKLSGAVGNIGGSVRSAATDVTEKGKSGLGWLLPALLIVGAIALVMYFMKGCGGDKKADVAVAADTATVKEPVTTEPAAPVSYKVKLPDGTELDALKGGIEDQLVGFLSTDWKALGVDSLKKVWFDFDNLNFETGSSNITASSMAQVKNLVAILKAFPAAKLKIGGYTDRVGDAAANKKLSQGRADAVAAAIVANGGNKAQIAGAEGYGEEFAKVDEKASDAERKSDRRTAVSVRQ